LTHPKSKSQVTKINDLTLKFIWKCKELRIAKTVFKKYEVEDLPNFKTYHKVRIIKMVYIDVTICKVINKINTESRNVFTIAPC